MRPLRFSKGRVFWFLALTAAILLVLGAARWVCSDWIRHAFPQSVLVLDRNGGVLRLTTAQDGQYRLWTRLSEFAPETVEAVLTKEDRSFWWNPGVNPVSLAKAAWHSLVVRDYRFGASTVTMQAVRLMGRLDTDNLWGKLVQMTGAFFMTLLVNKQDILEVYLNLAPCGANVQGLGTASRIWFGKPAYRLNFAESMALAVLPQDPVHRNPGNPRCWPIIDQARRQLSAIYADRHPGAVAHARESMALNLVFRRELPFLAPHLCEALIRDHPGRSRLVTRIDPAIQGRIEKIVARFTQRNRPSGVNNAAVMVVQADSMEVLASLGSADFHNEAIQGQVDGTRAKRSPGSTLKPFIYALAMEQGLIHPMSVLKDSRIHFGGYNPDNFDDDFEGPIRATEALVKSRNVPAVTLAEKLHDPDLYGFLQNSGAKLPFTREHYGLSLVLGGAEVSMEELAYLYGALAGPGEQAGTTRPLHYLADEPPGPVSRLLSARSAWLVRRMLATKPRPDADEGWTAGSLQSDSAAELSQKSRPGRLYDVAYKTGTSIGFRDAWSVGLCGGVVIAVWVGDFAGSSNQEFIGLKTAAPLMFEILDALRSSRLLQGYEPVAGDSLPAGIVRVPVCAVSGEIAGDHCPQTIEVPFMAGVSPIRSCTVHKEFFIDQTTGLRRTREIPGVTKPEVFEVWPADLMELFAKAGLARAAPPPLDPGDSESLGLGRDGTEPQILSPVKKLKYVLQAPSQTGFLGAGVLDEQIPLVSTVGSDAQTVWWFMDEKLLGSTAATAAPLLWKPTMGHHQVRLVDDLGRSAQTEFDVE